MDATRASRTRRRNSRFGEVLALACLAVAATAFGYHLAPVVTPSGRTPSVPVAAVEPAEHPEHSSYVLMHRRDGSNAAAWDRCRPLRWVLRDPTGDRQLRYDIAMAMAEIEAVTPWRFLYDGETSDLPTRARRGGGDADVVIAVVDAGETSELDAYDHAAGGAWTHPFKNDDGIWELSAGAVLIRAETLGRRPGGFGPSSRASLVLHELGHILGLGHVDSGESVMHAAMGSGAATLSAGDRDGLAELAWGAACAS
jgi:hypothetical protein